MALEATISKSTEEMDTQFNQELELVLTGKYPLDDFLDDWGMSFEELLADDSIGYPQEESLMRLKGIEGTHQSMNEDFVPDYTKTAEYEGDGITSELIPGESLIAPLLQKAGLDPAMAAVVGSVVTKKPQKGMLSNKIFASKALKSNQKTKRGVEGPVVTGASRTLKDSNLRPSIKNKTADKYKAMTSRVKQKNATNVAAGVTGAAIVGGAINRGLKGNRNAQGDFTVFDEDRLDPPTGPDMPEEVTPEASENQFGYHKREGQNFWTVDNDDSYWDTHDIEGSSAFEGAPLKQQPQQELDWDFWFK